MIQKMQLTTVKGKGSLTLRPHTAATAKLLGSAVAGLLMLAACASAQPPPTADIQAAEQAIAEADRSRVADYSSLELSEARDKLTAARSAVQSEHMDKAQRLAQQAKVDAQLASAKAEVASAEVVNQDMQESIDMLKLEMQRSPTGEKL